MEVVNNDCASPNRRNRAKLGGSELPAFGESCREAAANVDRCISINVHVQISLLYGWPR